MRATYIFTGIVLAYILVVTAKAFGIKDKMLVLIMAPALGIVIGDLMQRLFSEGDEGSDHVSDEEDDD